MDANTAQKYKSNKPGNSSSFNQPSQNNSQKSSLSSHPDVKPNNVSSNNILHSIWVGNLQNNHTKTDLIKIFIAFGKLAEPPISKFFKQKGSETNGYVFINFESAETVNKILVVNPKICLDGQELLIRRSLKPRFRSTTVEENENGDDFNDENKFMNKGFGVNPSRFSSGSGSRKNGASYGGGSNFKRKEGEFTSGFGFNSRKRRNSGDSTNSNATDGQNSSGFHNPCVNNKPKSAESCDKKWSLYVGNVPRGMAARLHEIFGQFGQLSLRDVEIRQNKTTPGRFYAFLKFTSPGAVESVLEKNLRVMIDGHLLEIRAAYSNKPNSADKEKEFERKKMAQNMNEIDLNVNSDKNDPQNQITPVSFDQNSPSEDNRTLQARNLCGLIFTDIREFLEDNGNFESDIEECNFVELENRVVIKYKNSTIANNALKQFEEIDDRMKIYVSKLPPICQKLFYFHNLPSSLIPEQFNGLLREQFKGSVEHVKYRSGDSGALVTFSDDLELEKVQNWIKNSGLKKNASLFKVYPVRFTDAVLIYGQLPSNFSICKAFEQFFAEKIGHNSSNNGVRFFLPVKDQTSTAATLIIFENYQSVLLLDDFLRVENEDFPLVRYYDCMGPINSLSSIRNSALVAELFRIQLHPVQFKFVKNEKNLKKIVQELKKSKNLEFSLTYAVNHTLIVSGNSQNLPSTSISNFINQQVPFTEMEIDYLMHKSIAVDHSKFERHLKTVSNDVIYILTANSLSLASKKIDCVEKSALAFLDSLTLYPKILSMNLIEASYLKKFGENKLKSFSWARDLTWTDQDFPKIHENKENLSKIQQELHQILANFQAKEFDASNYPGLFAYFLEHSDCMELKIIENETETVISTENGPDLLKKLNNSNVGHLELDGFYKNIRISVITGDIFKQNVDVLAIGTNENLAISSHLKTFGGKTIEEECQKFIFKHGKLNVTDCFESTAGKLPCKKLIHVVLPIFDKNRENFEENFAQAVKNLIIETNKLLFASIAIPLPSNGHNFPISKTISIIVKSVTSSPPGTIAEIKFVDSKKENTQIFVSELRNLAKFQQNLLHKLLQKYDLDENSMKSQSFFGKIVAKTISYLPFGRNHGEKSVEKSLGELPKIVPLPLPTASVQKTGQILMINNCKIELVKDDMANYAKNCDMIVNSTNAGIIGGGASCQAILRGAGDTVLNEIQSKYPNGMGQNPFVTTSGGGLKCKKICHLNCSHLKLQTNPFMSRITFCLNFAFNTGMTSIAFPAIGTGGLGLSASEVAQAMLKAIVQWIKLHQEDNTISRVILVLFPSDLNTISAFENEYKCLYEKENAKNPPKKGASFITSVRIGHVKVDVAENEFAKETSTDCLMVLTNVNLDLRKSDVIQAIISSGASFAGSLPKDISYDMFYSLGKNLMFLEAPGTPGEWVPVVQNSLEPVSLLRFTSASIMLLGTGKLCEHFSDVVNALFHAVQLFVGKGSCCIDSLRIVVYQSPNLLGHSYGPFSYNFDSAADSHSEKKLEEKRILRNSFSSTLNNHTKEYLNKSNVSNLSNEDPLIFYIYGSGSKLHEAKDKIEAFCERKCPEKRIKHEIIEYLEDDMMTKLCQEAKNFGVELIINQLLKEAKMKGYKSLEFREFLGELFLQLWTEIGFAEKSVQWYKKRLPGDWHPVQFGAYLLENAFLKTNGSGIVPISFEGRSGLTADFKKMAILEANSTKKWWCHLKRRDKNGKEMSKNKEKRFFMIFSHFLEKNVFSNFWLKR